LPRIQAGLVVGAEQITPCLLHPLFAVPIAGHTVDAVLPAERGIFGRHLLRIKRPLPAAHDINDKALAGLVADADRIGVTAGRATRWISVSLLDDSVDVTHGLVLLYGNRRHDCSGASTMIRCKRPRCLGCNLAVADER
jgi:hypothetical protein